LLDLGVLPKPVDVTRIVDERPLREVRTGK
jgi:hypothetical protein